MPNGLGPWWFPARVRDGLTAWGELFFDEAAWNKHDKGYDRGHPDRATCDRKFLQAMLRDASLAKTTIGTFGRVFSALFLWVCVRALGWASYNYRGTS